MVLRLQLLPGASAWPQPFAEPDTYRRVFTASWGLFGALAAFTWPTGREQTLVLRAGLPSPVRQLGERQRASGGEARCGWRWQRRKGQRPRWPQWAGGASARGLRSRRRASGRRPSGNVRREHGASLASPTPRTRRRPWPRQCSLSASRRSSATIMDRARGQCPFCCRQWRPRSPRAAPLCWIATTIARSRRAKRRRVAATCRRRRRRCCSPRQ